MNRAEVQPMPLEGNRWQLEGNSGRLRETFLKQKKKRKTLSTNKRPGATGRRTISAAREEPMFCI